MNFDQMIDRLNRKVPQPTQETYIDEDGFLCCSKCGGKLETMVTLFKGTDQEKTKRVKCVCKCHQERERARAEDQKKIARQLRIEEIRRTGFPSDQLKEWTFDNDDGSHETVTKIAKRYVENFEQLKEDGKGLIFYGGVGTGKTFMAAAIADALYQKGYATMVTNFNYISNKLQESFEGKQAYMNSLNIFDLLVIDDFGAERKTEYMQEIIFNVIDSRYRSGKPMLITTNLDLEAIKNPATIEEKRIMDRVLEKCFPVEVKGGSHRRKNVREQYGDMKDLLGLN